MLVNILTIHTMVHGEEKSSHLSGMVNEDSGSGAERKSIKIANIHSKCYVGGKIRTHAPGEQ